MRIFSLGDSGLAGCEPTLYLATSCSITIEDARDRVKLVSGSQLIGNPGSPVLPCLVGTSGSRPRRLARRRVKRCVPGVIPSRAGGGDLVTADCSRTLPQHKTQGQDQKPLQADEQPPVRSLGRGASKPAALSQAGAAVLRLEGINDGANE